MILTPEQVAELSKAAAPLMEFLKQFHPHVAVMVDSEGAEMVEGIASVRTTPIPPDVKA